LVETDLFTDVELKEDEDRAGEWAGGGRRGLGERLGHPVKDGTEFARVVCRRQEIGIGDVVGPDG
jgi:hypothetical protein